MLVSIKPVVGLVVGATLLAGAPMVAATDGGDRRVKSPTLADCWGGDRSRGGDLNVVGLTADSRHEARKGDPRDRASVEPALMRRIVAGDREDP